jgi:predicted phosphodiesterase
MIAKINLVNFSFRQILVLCLLLSINTLSAQQNKPINTDNKPEPIFNTSVPEHLYDIILGRPTKNSVTISVLSYFEANSFVVFHEQGKTLNDTVKFNLKANLPQEIILFNLKPSTRYVYNLYFKQNGCLKYEKSIDYYFHTPRNKNEDFIFTITADSHLDQNADTSVYKATLLNVLSDSADFHIDLGDTYMIDKYHENYKSAQAQYIAQRYYFGLICHTSPLFLVLGNHDGEAGQRLNGRDDNMTVWSNLTRKKYFPNPIPDSFYSGNKLEEPFVGLTQDYYSWEWGNALFVVLDPFWYTTRAGNDNPWERTLSKKQNDWLKTTLENSKAEFKFIFIHNLVGGADLKGKARGGVEFARMYEWGGLNSDGTEGFKAHRPGWDMPIHDLLVKYNITAVFHGHDHLFAAQELDGIIYQCIPQPGAKESGNIRSAGEYGYTNGVIKNGPGYMRISVSKKAAVLEYIGTNSNDQSKNKDVIYKYKRTNSLNER